MQNYAFRDYLIILIKHTKKLLIVNIAIALLVMIVVLIVPSQHDGAAMLILTYQTYSVQFEDTIISGEPISTQIVSSTYNVAADIANSPFILQQVLDDLDNPTQWNIEDLADLQDITQVDADNTGGTIRLIVQHSAPEAVVSIANLWADITVEYINGLYNVNNINDEDVEALLAELTLERQEIEAEIAAFISTDERAMISTMLANSRSEILILLEREFELTQINLLLESFATALNARNPQASVNLSDEFVMINLALRVYANPDNAANLFEIQTGLPNFSNMQTTEQMLAQITQLQLQVVSQLEDLANLQMTIEVEEQDLQLELELLNITYHYLVFQRDLNLTIVESLQTKLVELETESGLPQTVIQVATYAVQGAKSTQISQTIVGIIVISIVFVLSLCATIAYEFWQRELKPQLEQQNV